MKTLTQEQIKAIAEQIDSGFRIYWNKNDGELLYIPDPDEQPEYDMDDWSDDVEKLAANETDYLEIEHMRSRDSFKIMASFIETLADTEMLKVRLREALAKRKPFSEFKYVIDTSGAYRQKWFDHKTAYQEKWVIDRFNETIDEEE